jgi:hypothetical protein
MFLKVIAKKNLFMFTKQHTTKFSIQIKRNSTEDVSGHWRKSRVTLERIFSLLILKVNIFVFSVIENKFLPKIKKVAIFIATFFHL